MAQTGSSFMIRNSPRNSSKRKQPLTPNVSLNSQQKNIEKHLSRKFQMFLNLNRLKDLKSKLSYFYGRNYPIQYQDDYNFEERWETSLGNNDSYGDQFVTSDNWIVQTMFLIILLSNCFLIWSISIERVFQEGTCSILRQPTAIIGLISRFLSIISKKVLNQQMNDRNFSRKTLISLIGIDVGCIVYFVLLFTPLNTQSTFFLPLEVLMLIYLYQGAKKYYQFFRILEFILKYEYQSKLADLFITLLTIAHSISLMLWMATWYSPNSNWSSPLHLPSNYLIKYLYSFYFCSTSILTIGYGDISPENWVEVIVVLFMQFFGVVVFGYLVNQIGYTLSIMRTNDQILQKDLVTLNKLEKLYKLQKHLINQTKNFLVNNQGTNAQVTVEDQKNLFSKLNEELRNVIVAQKSLAVVKSSIFFLCRWTKQMQNNLANCLQKAVFSPNEMLPQPLGKERIYIIQKGKVDISIANVKNKADMMRTLKTINTEQTKPQIKNNVFGYTFVIGGKPNRLKATSTEFTSCYFIQKDAFLKCLSNQLDKEYYHEIKRKLQEQPFIQAIQAPLILNNREHYNPSRIILLKKNQAQLRKKKNNRKVIIRSSRRAKMETIKKPYFYLSSYEKDKQGTQEHEIVEATYNPSTPSDQIGSKQEDYNKEQFLKNQQKDNSSFIDLQQQVQGNQNKPLSYQQLIQQKSKPINRYLSDFFQRHFEYFNFFPKNNLSQVLDKLQRQEFNFKRNESKLLPNMDTNETNAPSMRKIIDQKQFVKRSRSKRSALPK